MAVAPSRAPSGGGGGATAVGVDSPGNMAGGAGAGTAIHFNPTPAPAGTPAVKVPSSSEPSSRSVAALAWHSAASESASPRW